MPRPPKPTRTSGKTNRLSRLLDPLRAPPQRAEFAFATPYARHVSNLVRIADRLRARGHDTAFIAIHDLAKNGDAGPALKRQDAPVVGYRHFQEGRFRPELVVVLHDTGLATKPLVERAHELDVPTAEHVPDGPRR